MSGHRAWREPDADRSHYGAASSHPRGIAIGATVAVHLAVGMLLLQHLAENEDMTMQASSSPGLSVFFVPNTGAADAAEPAPPSSGRIVTNAVLPQPATTEPALPAIAAVPDNASTAARQGSQFWDPFAAAALTVAPASPDDVAAAMPVVRSTVPDPDVQVLLTAIRQLQQTFPNLTGTAILRCAVAADGRVAQASFLGGSVGEPAGARLAQALVGQPLYPMSVAGGMRTALLGPFGVPLTAEQPL